MNVGQLQAWLDSLAQVSAQRWLLIAVAMVAAIGAPTATTLAMGTTNPAMFVVVAVLALVSVVQPDSYAPLVVGALVVWQWLSGVDEVTSGWAILVSICLFVFHTLIALMASTPASTHVDRRVIVRWLRRCGAVVAATGAMWLIVAVVGDRQATSAEALTAAGFVVLTGLVIAVQGTIVTRKR